MEARIEGHSDLLKNMDTGAVVNTDRTAYERYMQSKKQHQKLNTTVEDINNLKQEIFEIKTLLKELLKKND
jgi:hypothetical protein